MYKAAAVAQVALHCSLQSCDSRCVRSHALTENRVATSTPLERGKGGRCLGRKQERKGKDGSEMKGNGKGSLEAVLDVFLAKRIRSFEDTGPPGYKRGKRGVQRPVDSQTGGRRPDQCISRVEPFKRKKDSTSTVQRRGTNEVQK